MLPITNTLKPLKCESCSKVLAFINIKDGIISKDCPKCGHRNVVVFVDSVEKRTKK